MKNTLNKITDFNNSAAFNQACKLVYWFMTALAIGLFLSELRGVL
jgi:hypothetical protein